MKKLFLILIYTISVNLVFAQSVQLEPLNTDTTRAKADSQVVRKTDTMTWQQSNNASNDIKFIFQENNSPDYFKYWFPIITLLLGIGVNKVLDYLKHRTSIKSIGQVWKAELLLLKEPIQKQVSSLEKFLSEHQQDKYEVLDLIIHRSLYSERFDLLDRVGLIKYVRRFIKRDYQSAIEYAANITDFICVLKFNVRHLTETFNEYRESSSQQISSLSININEMLTEYNIFSSEVERKSDMNSIGYRNQIKKLIDKQIAPNQESGNFDIYVLERDFFMPLAEILYALRLDKSSETLMRLVNNSFKNIKGYKAEKKYLTIKFLKLIENYKNDADNLSKILAEFK